MVWSDMKGDTKDRVMKFKKLSNQTGGGPPPEKLSLLHEKISTLIGDTLIFGVPVVCEYGTNAFVKSTAEPGTSGINISVGMATPPTNLSIPTISPETGGPSGQDSPAENRKIKSSLKRVRMGSPYKKVLHKRPKANPMSERLTKAIEESTDARRRQTEVSLQLLEVEKRKAKAMEMYVMAYMAKNGISLEWD